MNLKKVISRLSVFAFIIGMNIIISSCSSDEHGFEVDGEPTLVNSVAESDEFLDFKLHCMSLAEKVQSYTSTLTKEEFDELMNNLNNDDYMMRIVDGVNLMEDLAIVENARNNLLNNTDFHLLNESEQTTLFITNSVSLSKVMVKTRGEGGGVGSEECRRRLNEDYAYASAIYLAAMVGCSCATGGLGVCLCAIAASAAYDYAITLADRSYYDCMQNA